MIGQRNVASSAMNGVVACLNNYPLDKMRDRAARAEGPAQHMWGIDGLAAAGWRVRLMPFHEPDEKNILAQVSTRTGWRLGQLDQEWAAIRMRPDVIYSADQGSARGLALLRTRARKVCVVHHPISAGPFVARTYGGFDRLLALSPAVADGINGVVLGGKAEPVAWGPDLSSPVYAVERTPEHPHLVVSGGKSNRDLPTLVSALGRSGHEALVYDLACTVSQAPANVQLVQPGGRGLDPESPTGYLPGRVYEDLRRASVIAVPVRNPNRLTGLTEVNDALALGVPVIVTRSPYLPVDVDAIGCGISVAPGDVDGWIEALHTLADPNVRAEMGKAGRNWAEQFWNYRIFCEQVRTAVGDQ